MIGLAGIRRLQPGHSLTYIIYRPDSEAFQHRKEPEHDLPAYQSVIRSAVVIELGKIEMARDSIELMALQVLEQRSGKSKCIDIYIRKPDPVTFCCGGHETDIK
jgi:hypothetical protein